MKRGTCPRHKIEESLRYSFLDGVFASAMIGFTQDFFIPFILLLGGTARQVAMLSAFPNLFASLAQVKSADLAERLRSRKLIINLFVFLQALILLPMIGIARFKVSAPLIFISVAVLYTAFGAVVAPAWGSLMSDHIEFDRRGSYFGWRNKMLGLLTVGAAFIGGAILTAMKRIDIFHGFVIIFTLAFLCRLASLYFLHKMYEPHLDHSKEHHFTLFDFVSRMRKSNFGKFVLFASLMSFSVHLASPFFSVLMLRELHYSYFLYTVTVIAATITIYFAMERWGRHADIVGNMKIIRFTAPLLGFIPLLWILNRRPPFLVFVQVFSGFMWAGFNLCTSNFIFDAVTPEKRIRCISYFNMFNGVAICIGSLTGGFLLRYLPPLVGYKILTLFLISAVLRITVGIIMPTMLKEVRPVKEIKNRDLFFSVIGLTKKFNRVG